METTSTAIYCPLLKNTVFDEPEKLLREKTEMDTQKEAAHFDEVWRKVRPTKIIEELPIPGAQSLIGKRILICSCGSGRDPVRAANSGAEVFAVDLSPAGVQKSQEMAAFNHVSIDARVMDLHHLEFPDDYFDVLYGSAILHHLDCAIAGAEFWRVLKNGGIGFFEAENTDRNPILAFFYRAMSGTDANGNFKKYWFVKRIGTTNERMFCRQDLDALRRYFPNALTRTDSFMFFQKISHVAGLRAIKLTRAMDKLAEFTLPATRRYSYEQDIWFSKQI
jgi:ubiquinone/menaquinone biosynthesis C-methylase UbiE